jgi:hypothetical protein
MVLQLGVCSTAYRFFRADFFTYGTTQAAPPIARLDRSFYCTQKNSARAGIKTKPTADTLFGVESGDKPGLPLIAAKPIIDHSIFIHARIITYYRIVLTREFWPTKSFL